MQTRHPLRAALVATIVPLVAILALGNTWYTEHVRLRASNGPVLTRLVITSAPFTWTFTPRRGGGAGTIWFAQGLAIAVVLVGTFLVTWAVARHATGLSLFLGAWGTTVLVAMLGAFVATIVSYGTFFGDANPDDLGRFWHSVYQAQNVALWGAGVGLFVGLFAAALVGGVDTRPGYVTSAPLPGSAPVWEPGPMPSPGMPTQQAPVVQGSPAPPPWSQQTYVTAPVFTDAPAAAEPLAAPSSPPPPQPPRPAGDPTVVMVQPGEPPPPPAPPPAPPPTTDQH